MDEQKRILIIEDEKPIAQALNENLRGEGYVLITTTNGVEGLSVAKTLHPHLILLDLILPGKDGITVLRELRQDEWGKNADVLILTNLSDPDSETQAVELNALDYVLKAETSIKEFANRVKEILG